MSEPSRFPTPAALEQPVAEPSREQGESGEALAPVSGSVGQQLRSAREASTMSLAVVAQLVQAHGGHIGVESTVGKGTAFVVELPAGTQESAHH